MTRRLPAPDREAGTGALGTAAGVLVFLCFLLFAVQLLFSLYATSTVRAVTGDAAHRAATQPTAAWPGIEAEARALLGEVGRTAEFRWRAVDADGDGADDAVSLTVVARPPRFVPRSLGVGPGAGEVRHTAVARIERTS